MPPAATAALLYGALSVLAFSLYGWDKHRARCGRRRVPEARLHVLALLGGFAGAWLGMVLFRHKTKKRVFVAALAAAVLLHAAAWAAWLVRLR